MSEELLNILTAIHNENSEIYELLISSYIDENTTFYGSKREEIIREKMELFNKQFDTVKLEIQGVWEVILIVNTCNYIEEWNTRSV